MSDIFRDWSFGGQLKAARLKREIPMREMARRLKMDCGNYSKIEMSRLSPPNTLKKIKALVKPLNLDGPELDMLIIAALNHHIGKLNRKFYGDPEGSASDE